MKVTEYSYVLQFFKKLKLSTKLVPGQLSIHIKIYLEPFVSFLLPFFIYLKSSKCIFATRISPWNTGSFVKTISVVTFMGKCPPHLLVHICRAYCFSFMSVWLQHLMSLLVFPNSMFSMLLFLGNPSLH